MKQFFVLLLLFLVTLFPVSSYSATQDDLERKMDELNRQMEELKKQIGDMKTQDAFQEKSISAATEKAEEVANKWSWLSIGGEYRFRVDSLRGKVHDYMQYSPTAAYTIPDGRKFRSAATPGYSVKNDSIMFNRFKLKVNAAIYENIHLASGLVMYKTWGHGTINPVDSSYFADRTDTFDGTIGHIPQDSTLRVDYVMATISNIADTPAWFSIGRRYSTMGVPTNIRQNAEKLGTGGVAGHLIDYAFDGLTIGYAPYIEALPGAYAKFCYGRGYDSGFKTEVPGAVDPKDTDFLGIFFDPIYTDNLNVELQFVRANDIFSTFPDAGVTTNLGDIDFLGAYVSGKLENVGIGDLNLFVSGAYSMTHPNENLYELSFFSIDGGSTYREGGYGLLYNDADPMTAGGQGNDSHSGSSVYAGLRYDIKKTGTKVGLEYNYGTKYWITFTPAADDLWTSKLGTRGSVYEGYIIQELPGTPVAKFGKAYVRVGYQLYKFKYTGSNNWIGEPERIRDLNTTDPSLTQNLAPLDMAQDIYATFDVSF